MEDRLGRFLMRKRIAAVLPHVRGRLLDVGCGTNELVKAYSGDGVGVDVYPWEEVDLVVDDASDLPYDDASFDCGTIVAALNHIPNRRQVLREVERVLRPEGRIIVTMIPPGISRVWHFLRRPWDADQRKRGMVEGEVYGLTRREVEGLLTEAGFEKEHESTFMLGLNRVVVAHKRRAARGP